jgi:hypothetical protein
VQGLVPALRLAECALVEHYRGIGTQYSIGGFVRECGSRFLHGQSHYHIRGFFAVAARFVDIFTAETEVQSQRTQYFASPWRRRSQVQASHGQIGHRTNRA